MESAPTTVIPLAIRFVPYDQWLVTHIAASWKTKQVKQYILSKCLPFSSYVRAQAPEPPQPRSLSPITFASATASRSRRSLDQRSVTSVSVKGDDDGEDEIEDEEDDDADDVFPMEQTKHARHYHNTAFATGRPSAHENPSPAPKSTRQSRSESRTIYHHSHFSILTYSTFHLLEDDYTISWYRLRPYELLEMHLSGAIVRLQRESVHKYIEPYFECKVKALRVIYKESRLDPDKERDKDKDKEKEKDKDKDRGKFKESKHTSSQTSSSSSSRILSTASDPTDPLPLRKSKIEWREKWITIRHGILSLCKDRNDTSSSQCFPLASLRTMRGSEHLQNASSAVPSPRHGETIVCAKFKQAPPVPHVYPSHSYSSSSYTGGSVHSSSISSGTGLYVDEYGRRGSAGRGLMGYDEISEEREDERNDKGSEGVWLVLDMLDEYAYTSILRILHRYAPSTLASSFVPPQPDPAAALPYPEWRHELVARARRVGMGDLGPVLEWALLGEEGKKKDWMSGGCADDDDDDDNGEESEKEWEGWLGDLERQRKVRKEKREKGKEHELDVPSSPSNRMRQLPPMRVFSPPSASFASASHAGIDAPFTDANANAIHMAKVRTTTTSTVSAGGRVRSTTVSVTSGGKSPPASSKGPALKLSLFGSGSGSGRDGEAVRYDFAPNDDADVPSALRHATSLENVRGEHARWDGRALHSAVEGGGGKGRKKLGLVRGISVKAGAERLVRGWDSALDFVEGK